MKHYSLSRALILAAVAIIGLIMPQNSSAHVPHDIIYSLGLSPDYAEDNTIFVVDMADDISARDFNALRFHLAMALDEL